MSQRGEAAALSIGQAQLAPAEVGFEDTVSLGHIGDHLLLMALEPPGDHHDEHVQNHGVPLG